jgi:hypothetical protein
VEREDCSMTERENRNSRLQVYVHRMRMPALNNGTKLSQ